MRIDHAIFRRPAFWLATALLILALPLLGACGTTAQSESAAPAPAEHTSTSSEQSAAENAGRPADGAASTDSTSVRTGHGDHGSASAAVAAETVMINLPIVARTTTLTRADLRVTQGDTVRLTLTSDEPGEVHLHGYDLTASVSPDHPAELTFEATTAGAFGINFHVFGGDSLHSDSITVESETPVSVAITAEPDAHGGVNVRIATEGFRFAEELVDQPHAPGVGHAHIYVDGEKLGRVFDSEYHIPELSPGEREIRVSLNINDHSELVYDGANVESTVTVTVPDVGQGTEHGESHGAGDGHSHGGDDHSEKAIVAEVHLGNLEVYP